MASTFALRSGSGIPDTSARRWSRCAIIARTVHFGFVKGNNADTRYCQTVCKPGSVPPESGDGHSSGTFVTERLARPTRAAARKARPATLAEASAACRSYLVLLPVGFTLPPPLPAARCALTAPFHPYRTDDLHRAGGLLSVALSLGAPPPGATRHPVFVEPRLSSPPPLRAEKRPPRRLAGAS